jgi:hypothetical protein
VSSDLTDFGMKWSSRFYSVSQHPILDDYTLGKAEKQLFPNKAMTREKRPGRHIHEAVGKQEEEAQTALLSPSFDRFAFLGECFL